ncbi:hypothetical protein PCASD_23130 [Puccinia coronata f. sp. avenae]|uniref:Uncharacterized protein n=1 Tax=Puccinia coronata f. sp. avenae TaxID=200324 RepID=A0A2N5SAC8_9BASI|nr:hypothetical protein PCASD_23130 [Puccinia coronata f. sp. avenae]
MHHSTGFFVLGHLLERVWLSIVGFVVFFANLSWQPSSSSSSPSGSPASSHRRNKNLQEDGYANQFKKL